MSLKRGDANNYLILQDLDGIAGFGGPITLPGGAYTLVTEGNFGNNTTINLQMLLPDGSFVPVQRYGSPISPIMSPTYQVSELTGLVLPAGIFRGYYFSASTVPQISVYLFGQG